MIDDATPTRIDDENTDPQALPPPRPRRARDDARAGMPYMLLGILLMLFAVAGIAAAGGR